MKNISEESNRVLLQRAIGAVKAGDHEEAQFLLEWLLMRDITREQRVQTLYLLATIQADPAQKRRYLHDALALDPWHPEARRALAQLEGRLAPDDIIDPNQSPPVENAAPAAPPSEARRFVCIQCGGQLAFLPQGTKLHCAHCGHTISLLQALDEGAAVEERDFFVDLVTRRGHTSATRARTFTCHTCGATYLSETLSLAFTCPYCHSAYVAEQEETRDIVPPEGVIPMRLSANDAERAIRAWLTAQKMKSVAHVEPPHGVYLPVWTFDIGGLLIYTYRIVRTRNDNEIDFWNSGLGGPAEEIVRSEWPVLADDIPVLATHSLPADLAPCVRTFDFRGVQPFASEYLAGWPAETYAIPPADASIVARSATLTHERQRLERQVKVSNTLSAIEGFHVDSSRMYVEAFKLVLVPFWLSRYTLRTHTTPFMVVVNGQNGRVCGQTPRTFGNWRQRLRRWLGL